MCGRCYISHIGEVLLSISSAYHIHLLCKMHFESCAISHDYQSKRYEKQWDCISTKENHQQEACLCFSWHSFLVFLFFRCPDTKMCSPVCWVLWAVLVLILCLSSVWLWAFQVLILQVVSLHWPLNGNNWNVKSYFEDIQFINKILHIAKCSL